MLVTSSNVSNMSNTGEEYNKTESIIRDFHTSPVEQLLYGSLCSDPENWDAPSVF